MLPGQVKYRFHIGALPEEVYRHNGPGTRGDGFAYGLNTDVESAVIRLCKHCLQPQELNHLNGGYKGKVGGYNLITRLETQRHHCYLESIGAVAT